MTSAPPRRSTTAPRTLAGSPRNTRTPAHRARIRILVTDGYGLDRRGMVGLLKSQRDFEVVGEAATVAEAIALASSLRPDVLVLAQSTPVDQGSAVAALRAAIPGARVLAIADRSPEHCVVLNPPSRDRLETMPATAGCIGGTDCLELAVRDGAMGTLRRSAAPAELFQAVRAVAAGSAWLEPGTAARLAAGAGDAGAVDGLALSERELDVAAMIAEGRSNKEISTTLTISEPTVKKYVGRLLEKLRVEDRLQAGLYLARHPLVLRRRAAAGR
jgi:DNA-binding NarL/FixJ family response regulator